MHLSNYHFLKLKKLNFLNFFAKYNKKRSLCFFLRFTHLKMTMEKKNEIQDLFQKRLWSEGTYL
jgi:hypothetical protein